jgi:hypothetical protein
MHVSMIIDTVTGVVPRSKDMSLILAADIRYAVSISSIISNPKRHGMVR